MTRWVLNKQARLTCCCTSLNALATSAPSSLSTSSTLNPNTIPNQLNLFSNNPSIALLVTSAEASTLPATNPPSRCLATVLACSAFLTPSSASCRSDRAVRRIASASADFADMALSASERAVARVEVEVDVEERDWMVWEMRVRADPMPEAV